MPKKARHVPSYRLHKPSGQARVIINGEHVYLGKYGSSESQEKYDRVVAEWLAARRTPVGSQPGTPVSPTTINDLILAFWHHAGTVEWFAAWFFHVSD